MNILSRRPTINKYIKKIILNKSFLVFLSWIPFTCTRPNILTIFKLCSYIDLSYIHQYRNIVPNFDDTWQTRSCSRPRTLNYDFLWQHYQHLNSACGGQAVQRSRGTSRSSQKTPSSKVVITSSMRTWMLFTSWNLVITGIWRERTSISGILIVLTFSGKLNGFLEDF